MDSSTGPRLTRILLTGPPGIGKTTICKKIVSIMTETKYRLDGFYTEEVRGTDKNRIGFDIVSLKNNHDRGPLARTAEHLAGRKSSKARVGNYHVFVKDFENFALPIFNSESDILLIDEIGKMELFSEKFKENIEKVFFSRPKEKRQCIIATIPERNKVPQRFADFFDKLREDENSKLIEVNRQCRDNLPETIARMIQDIFFVIPKL